MTRIWYKREPSYCLENEIFQVVGSMLEVTTCPQRLPLRKRCFLSRLGGCIKCLRIKKQCESTRWSWCPSNNSSRRILTSTV